MHKNIAYGGMGTAFTVILLMLASYLPTGKAAFVFAASLAVLTVSYISGIKTALIMYGASCLLSFFAVPSSSLAIIISYVVCLGNYPVIKRIIEGRRSIFSAASKIVLYAVYFTLIFIIFKYFFPVDLKYSIILLFTVGAAVFAFYDFLLSRTNDYVLRIIMNKKR